MLVRTTIGVVLGGAIGLGVGYFGAKSGGTCPITCNPWVATIFGAVCGGMIGVGAGGAPARDEAEPDDEPAEEDGETE